MVVLLVPNELIRSADLHAFVPVKGLRCAADRARVQVCVSLIDPLNRCREVKIRTRLADARIVAEGRVRFENRPRPA
jgi:hypothetical protein